MFAALRWLAASVIALLVPMFATAGGPYHYNSYHGCNYYQPYQKEYVVQKVVAQEIAVAPLIVTIPVDSRAVPIQNYGVPYYYSVSDAYQQKAMIREILREELRGIGAAVAAPVPGPMYSTAPPTVVAPPAVSPPGTIPGTTPVIPLPHSVVPSPPKAVRKLELDTQTPDALQQKLLVAFDSSCTRCHGPAKASGGLQLSVTLQDGSRKLAKLPTEVRWMIYGYANVGIMPPAAATDPTQRMDAKHMPTLIEYASRPAN